MSDALALSLSICGRCRPVAALIAVVFATACLPAAFAADRPASFPVTAAQMQSLGIQLQRLGAKTEVAGLSYAARVVLPPGQQQLVSAPVMGVVDQLLVSENEVVKQGQALLRLLSPELGELQLRFLEAASRHALAAKTLQRERQLLAEGIIPERRVQEAEADAAEAQARRKQSETALRLAGMDDAQISRISKGDGAENALVLRARRAGVVSELSAKPGQRVQAADALLQIADTRALWLDIQVPVARQAEVATAKGASIQLAGRDSVQATVLSAGSAVGDGQTFVLRAEVLKGGQTLRPGEFVQVRLPFAEVEGWVVPLQAIAREGDKAYVFVRTGQGFEARPVNILATGGTSVRVKGDLQADQQIAITSVIALKAAWQGKGGGE